VAGAQCEGASPRRRRCCRGNVVAGLSSRPAPSRAAPAELAAVAPRLFAAWTNPFAWRAACLVPPTPSPPHRSCLPWLASSRKPPSTLTSPGDPRAPRRLSLRAGMHTHPAPRAATLRSRAALCFRADAVTAQQRYNGATLDGMPMSIEAVAPMLSPGASMLSSGKVLTMAPRDGRGGGGGGVTRTVTFDGGRGGGGVFARTLGSSLRGGPAPARGGRGGRGEGAGRGRGRGRGAGRGRGEVRPSLATRPCAARASHRLSLPTPRAGQVQVRGGPGCGAGQLSRSQHAGVERATAAVAVAGTGRRSSSDDEGSYEGRRPGVVHRVKSPLAHH